MNVTKVIIVLIVFYLGHKFGSQILPRSVR